MATRNVQDLPMYTITRGDRWTVEPAGELPWAATLATPAGAKDAKPVAPEDLLRVGRVVSSLEEALREVPKLRRGGEAVQVVVHILVGRHARQAERVTPLELG
jgi:hypothetical protein